MDEKNPNEPDETAEVVGSDEGPQPDLPPVSDSEKTRLEVVLDPEPRTRHQNPYAVDDAQREVRGRLNALEALRNEGTITDAEYQQARDITVYGPVGAAAKAVADKGGPPAGGGGKLVIGPGDGKEPEGRPIWLIPTLIGVGIVAVIALAVGLVFAFSSPGDDEVYAENVSAPLNMLGDSAGAIASNLAAVSEPGDVPGLRSAINSQIRAATSSSNKISRAQVPDGMQQAHAKLRAGATSYVLYLQALLRASSPTPSAAPAGISRAKAQVVRVKANFKAAQKLDPALNVDPIVDAGLGSTSGLAGAQRKKAAALEAERRRREEAARLADIARVRTGPSFQSPTGNIHCEDFGNYMACSTSNDNFQVWMYTTGTPQTTSGVVAGGETVPYGGSWRSGSFSCTSSESGVRCTNLSGNGFDLSAGGFQQF